MSVFVQIYCGVLEFSCGYIKWLEVRIIGNTAGVTTVFLKKNNIVGKRNLFYLSVGVGSVQKRHSKGL